ncbi:MAG: muramoyltetrapeptide carboxypeptidase [Burkholderiaceae bacterium]|jgi:muramoyltetrapeptide carboxypeptidase|uniref:Muramoyltetrapeptide carboxypeptidase n=1 Tax=Cupriavidus metallidurans TaxID=119219 RepID=A0A482IPS5_9BURK|nr:MULTISPECIES: muramoyltetrapeptide carboxypeptidase [Cupriavidus]KWR78407.1 LD-carboxypeptidase [Cupriavidus sp. SHE]PCH58121.1 MAG: muramoyltetrapeptide carboxypeptidase [Burkholderiaceae bacterium]QBP09573.1 muramoyltetrapeptide carboxypeptidase [Cupriavidus metallidurans]QWC89922.1 muramoyltetrapeptide carboxypeptidase [Cupriavidus metallidurans]
MSQPTEVRLIASSGYPHDVAIAARGCAWLKHHGYHVNNPDVLARRYLRFGGTDAERLADLHAIGTGPARELTLAVRGGYGLGRLLDRIEFGRIAEQASASGTPIVGHSDFTAFQLAYLAKAGGVSFAGPMLLADFGEEHVDSFMWRHFEGILHAPVHDIEVVAPQVAAPATVEGTLWGGNLAMLCTLLGTPYMPDIDGGILFLEDINEPPYRVERMLLQLLHAGVLAQQQAIVLGDFSNYRTTDYDNGYNMDAVFDYVREQLRIPVLTGLPFGHCPRKLTLPVGGNARLTARADGFVLSLSGYPTL